jgi:hypothetical protein
MRSKFVVKLTMKGPDSYTLPLTAEICGHEHGTIDHQLQNLIMFPVYRHSHISHMDSWRRIWRQLKGQPGEMVPTSVMSSNNASCATILPFNWKR